MSPPRDLAVVKVPVWVNGREVMEFVGIGARFGLTLESKEKRANQTRVMLADPPDSCTSLRNKLSGEVLMVERGNCSFVNKANIAEAAGASALLIINYRKELFKMVCEVNETNVQVGIHVVMLPQDAGVALKQCMQNATHVSVQMYSPLRPKVDVAELFLWLMAVGTILCGSYWSAWTAREDAVEQEKFLKDGSNEHLVKDAYRSSGFVYISVASSLGFIAIASVFMVILYKLMSYSLIEILVVMFCIGGAEGLQTCLVAALSWYIHTFSSTMRHSRQKFCYVLHGGSS